MNLKSLLARPFATYIYNKTRKSMATAVEDQEATLKMLLKGGKSTSFGKDHKLRDRLLTMPLLPRRCLSAIMSSSKPIST
jgi:hypothetical protein